MNKQKHRSFPFILPVLIAIALSFPTASFAQGTQMPGKTRTYYIAADEVDWDYAPGVVN